MITTRAQIIGGHQFDPDQPVPEMFWRSLTFPERGWLINTRRVLPLSKPTPGSHKFKQLPNRHEQPETLTNLTEADYDR